MTQLYECIWNDGIEVYFLSDISENNGYLSEDIEQVKSLKLNETVDLSDLSGLHIVKRIA
jgi:hypothetical protein